MELVADIDRERSLDAMWCAYLSSNSVAENLAKNRAGVVRALLKHRDCASFCALGAFCRNPKEFAVPHHAHPYFHS